MLTLRKGGHKDAEKYYSLMEIDFDSEELLSRVTLHRGLSNGSLELLVAYDDESRMEAGYALVATKNLYGYVLLKYLAVVPWYRGKGIGIELIRLINARYKDKQGIIAEITDFPDKDRQRKLAKFFARFGYVLVDCDYKISGTAAHVWVKPEQGTAELEPVIHRIIPDFYSRFMTAASMSRMISIKPAEK